MNTFRRRAFTLIEMMIVIAVVMILLALLFPSFSAARENARQKTCSSNLREIGMAVQMYRMEEKEYPMSLGALLPPSKSPMNELSLRLDNTTIPPTVAIDNLPADGLCDTATNSCPNVGGTGYLRDAKYLLCPDDHSSSTQPRSSYGDLSTGLPDLAVTSPPANPDDLSRRTWNYWGYRSDGVAMNNQVAAQINNGGSVQPPLTPNVWLVDASRKYVAPDTEAIGLWSDYRTNVVKNSLSNRFASPNTVITYCPFHRVYTSSLSSPELLYDPAEVANAVGARDLILRLDGSVRSVVVSTWGTTDTADPNFLMWQRQAFR